MQPESHISLVFLVFDRENRPRVHPFESGPGPGAAVFCTAQGELTSTAQAHPEQRWAVPGSGSLLSCLLSHSLFEDVRVQLSFALFKRWFPVRESGEF